jgi:DNA-directed RNA polymerase specialized sigma24 family protein
LLKSQAVAQYLPFLRRYARALTGSQMSGDAYVSATLEALIGDPAVMDEAGGPRVALYRLFTKLWNSVAINGEKTPVDPDMPADMRLAGLTPRPRQAFLLVALEGFSE